jgi:hypothetical protein
LDRAVRVVARPWGAGIIFWEVLVDGIQVHKVEAVSQSKSSNV